VPPNAAKHTSLMTLTPTHAIMTPANDVGELAYLDL
jgi:hypothetical protein